MKWTEADLDEALQGDATVRDGASDTEDTTKRSASMQAVAKGETRRGEMNDTERRWATLLDNSDHVAAWKYEQHGFRYGANESTHWPDFWVQRQDGHVEIHEVKGYVKEAGRLRFLACADRHPEYRWIMIVQSSRSQPWRFKYDTAQKEAEPFLRRED